MSTENAQGLEIISEKKRRLHLLKVRAAREGYDTPPQVKMEIQDLESEIAELERQADAAVAGTGVPAALLTGDPSAAGTQEAKANLPLPVTPRVATLPTHFLFAGSGQTSISSSPALVVDPPPIEAWMGRRTETVSKLVPEANNTTWFALHGTTSRGKTLLTRLLAEALGQNITWLQFAGLEEDGSSALIERFCATQTNREPPSRREQWYRAACQSLGRGAVLVFDDLPNLTGMPQFCSRLLPVVRECGAAGVRVLSSSMHQLPMSVRHALGVLVVEQAAPEFTESDVEEVIAAFNAPQSVVKEAVKVIGAITKQHPTLLVAACRYLQTLNWNLDGHALIGLFQGAHTTDLAVEVHQKLQRTVPDEPSRELLYRLTLIGGVFSLGDVDALAGATPPITSGREKLQGVTNSWVERRPDGRCAVSPLLGEMGKNMLPGNVKRECHLALANAIISRQAINQHDAFMAITHFHQGGDDGNAGKLLLYVLQKEAERPERLDGDPLLILWTRDPLPEGMDLNVRLIIRSLDVVIFHGLQKPLDYLFGDLNKLLSQADEKSMLGAAGAVSLVAAMAGRKHPLEAGKLLRQGLALYSKYMQRQARGQRRKTVENPFILSEEAPLHVLIWMLVGELTTPAHVSDWLDTLEAFPQEARRQAMAMDDGPIPKKCRVGGPEIR